MINSKKITLIAVILVAAALIFVTVAMLIPEKLLSGAEEKVLKYGEFHTLTISEDDYYTDYKKASYSKIKLMGTTATANTGNVQISDGKILISKPGTYVVSGTITDGSIIVDAYESGTVRIILDNAHISSSNFAALYVRQADKTVISSVKGTSNSLTDGKSYSSNKYADESVTAALYSRDDLVLNGEGSLTVTGQHSDGIKANDTLKLMETTLTVSAADDAVNANDCIYSHNSRIEIASGGDAVKCENTEDNTKGFIAFENVQLTVQSDNDGIYASSAVYLNSVNAHIITGGGSGEISAQPEYMPARQDNSQESAEDTASTKAIKAGENVVIIGGSYTLNSLDDAIHSDKDMEIDSAVINIESSDDAIHAEKNLVLSPKALNITKCYEGIEGGYITINSGDITVISNDDGINAVGENSGGGFAPPMATPKENLTDGDIYLTINGGNIYMEINGDGIDTNGAAVINGGNIEVYGPENSGNSSIDFQYGLVINGGNLVVAGSSGMAESPSDSSRQNTLVFYLDESFDSDSKITLKDANGGEILSGVSAKRFDFVCISSDKIKSGESYTLHINDSEITAVEVSDKITTSGNSRGRMMRQW